MNIKLETGNFQVYETESGNNIAIDQLESIEGAIQQAVANAVVNALKNGAGHSIREDSVEVTFTTTHIQVEEGIATYIGQSS